MNIKAGDLVTAANNLFTGYAYTTVAADSTSDFQLDPNEPVLCLSGIEAIPVDEKVSLNMVKVLTRLGVRYVFPTTFGGMQVTVGDEEESV
jgi:hypothetical protein